MTNNIPKTQANNDASTDFPLLIKCTLAVFEVVASRYVAIPISLLIVLISYIVDCYNQDISYLTSSGTLVAAVGLILSIKHHYLKNLSSIRAILNHYGDSAPLAERGYDSPDNVKLAISKAIDEGVGVALIIFGAIVSYFSPLIPLIALCNGA